MKAICQTLCFVYVVTGILGKHRIKSKSDLHETEAELVDTLDFWIWRL